MALQLTNLPPPWLAEPSLVDYGGDNTPAMGGAQARFVRVGSRWRVKFSSLPALSYADAQVFLAARFAASVAGSTVIASWPQIAATSNFGAPVVNGAGQGGNTLIVNGLTPNVALIPGLFFSLVTAGRNYLYQMAGAVTADAYGNATLPVSPWVRTLTVGGEALSFSAPQVEGFIDAGVNWQLDMQAWVTLPAFTITEVQ